jgi:putative phage-type endonuclease
VTRQKWLEERLNGIGGSEAAAIVGLSPYMTKEELWEIKTRRRIAEDISSKPYVEYGTNAEQHLRGLFALDHRQYRVGYEEFKIIRNPQHPFIFATLDGWLDDDSGRHGVLEIKTTEIMRSSQWDKWSDGNIPDNYYIQLLHQLLATGFDFAILLAQIKWHKNGDMQKTIRSYTLERADHEGSIQQLLETEIAFWSDVQADRRPTSWNLSKI